MDANLPARLRAQAREMRAEAQVLMDAARSADSSADTYETLAAWLESSRPKDLGHSAYGKLGS